MFIYLVYVCIFYICVPLQHVALLHGDVQPIVAWPVTSVQGMVQEIDMMLMTFFGFSLNDSKF